MQLSARFAREAILNKNGFNHLQIELIPPTLKQVSERKPVLIVLALDKSESMSEMTTGPEANRPKKCKFISKMNVAINASIKLLNLLTENDLLGIVSFDESAAVNQPLTNISLSTIQSVIANIRNIHPRGGTNISEALLTARNLITSEHLEKYTCKIILLSDGEPNTGILLANELSSIASDYMQAGITVSSLGLELKNDSSIMCGIAQSGGGLFYPLEDLSMLEEILKQELNLTAITKAKNVKLLLEIPSLIEIGQNLNSYPQKLKNGQIEILIGDIFSTRKVLLEIRNDFVNDNVIFLISTKFESLAGTNSTVKTIVPLKVVASEQELNYAKLNRDIASLVMPSIMFL
ncbi:MAG: vWA domain-containing protein [Desulfitobacteriaceae bacterium]